MMTLDEAIAHAKEMAKKLKAMTSVTDGKPYYECIACAKDHEQLASWLEELKRYKSQKVLIKVKPQDAKTLKRILQASQFGIAYPDTQYEVVPMVSDGQINRWIPVSERLPEEEGDYLIQPYRYQITIDHFVNGKFCFYNGDVTAWQPLPEPYKKGDQE